MRANLVINPTFQSSITSDPNAASIEAVINNVIGVYEATFADPITVNIDFASSTSGLGQSQFGLYVFTYAQFYAALVADASSADDAAALTRLAVDGTGTNNPVTGSSNVLLKPATAKALGLSTGASSDGTITLNTHITTPGSPGSSLTYSLASVAAHEIDEILGLGSTLGLGLGSPMNNDPSPEDFFRFTSAGARSFTLSPATAYFSINGVDDLAQYDNQADGGDYADWQSNPLPNGASPQVQDAFATPGANPTLGVELRALDVIGYTQVAATPEPGTFSLLAGALVLAGFAYRRKSA